MGWLHPKRALYNRVYRKTTFSIFDLGKTMSSKGSSNSGCCVILMPLLDFLENTINIEYTFRQVATESDFNYYIDHLQQPSYNAYDLIYLCFHGQKKCICFADKTDLDLMAFAEKEENFGIFEGRNVHFGSCSTLKMREEDIKIFKQLTKARMITGYTKDVDLTSSFIFETWLMDAINRNEGYAAKRINDLAEKEMPYFTKLFGFKAF